MDKTFSDLGISPKLLAILNKLGFTVPTQIQEDAIPVGLEGKDVIGIAQTGTGKTLAFSLPLLQQIARTKKRGLIVLPTRELAHQVDEELQKIGRSFGLRTVLLIGGAPIGRQIGQLSRKPHVIIGTPGRINDHLKQRTLNLSGTGVLVLDEADRMLDMGFAPQIKQILQHVPADRQTLLFSATMPREIMNITHQYMKNPIRVEVASAGTVTDRVEQSVYVLDRNKKNQLLEKLLTDYTGTVLVFSRTKHGAKKICRAVRTMGHGAAELHSNLSLSQRRRSLEGFKTGAHRVLIATDIAARGIDVNDIELVVNYDLPDNPEDYVHRVGRTGRAGKMGQAVSFAAPDQKKELNGIERSVNQQIPLMPLPSNLPASRPQDNSYSRGGYRSQGQQPYGSGRRTRSGYGGSSYRNNGNGNGNRGRGGRSQQQRGGRSRQSARVHT